MRKYTFEGYIRYDATDEYPDIALREDADEFGVYFEEVEGGLYTDQYGIEYVLIERDELRELLEAKTVKVKTTQTVEVDLGDLPDEVEITWDE